MSWSNVDESWWELRSESLHESFLNYHILVKRGWELTNESLHESFLNYHILVKRGWELMRVEKRDFVGEFFQLSCPGQTWMRVDESWEARACMRVFLIIMSWSNEDESWQTRVCMRVFSTIMSWSNEDESWWELRSESLHESFLNNHVLVKRGWELMRVEKWEFVWEFSQLSCPGQTRMRVDESWETRVCMRVFSTVMSWSNEDESWWELRSESLYESFLNYHVLVKRGLELMKWRSESLHESFLNYHVLVKRGWELMRVEKREFVWEFSQLSCPGQTRIRINEVEKREFAREFSQLSCPGQTRMRVDESWEARVCMRVFSTVMSWSNEDESWWELRSESLYESFLNYHVLVKRGLELMKWRSEGLQECFLN